MTKEDKRELAAVVNDAIRRAMEDADEKWLSAESLCDQFQCFSPSWLKRFGKHLNPTQAIVYDEDGTPHKTGWVYPMHKIQRMIRENKLVFYDKKKVEYRSSQAPH